MLTIVLPEKPYQGIVFTDFCERRTFSGCRNKCILHRYINYQHPVQPYTNPIATIHTALLTICPKQAKLNE